MKFSSIPGNYKTIGKYTLAAITPFVLLFVLIIILYFYKNSQNKKKGLKPIAFKSYFKEESKKEYQKIKNIFKKEESNTEEPKVKDDDVKSNNVK